MNYLDFGQIKQMLNQGKTLEQFIGSFKHEDLNTFHWISIYLEKNEYCLDIHEVFDERLEGIDSIYDFTYVEPDDLYGKRLTQTENFENLIEWTLEHFKISTDKFLPFNYLNDELKNEK